MHHLRWWRLGQSVGACLPNLSLKGQWLCEYKTNAVYSSKQRRDEAEEEYRRNQEGCYIVDTAYFLPGQGCLYFDATRKFHQLGRYLNHALNPNATLMPPIYVRGKWCIGFMSLTDINEGDEVVWDYIIRDMSWSQSTLVGGVVKVAEAAGVIASDVEENQKKWKGKSPAALRCFCYCPLEGCTGRPLRKLSNHLTQVHKMTPKERSKYLGLKNKFASPQEIAMRKKATLNPRRSQRSLTSFFQAPGPSHELYSEDIDPEDITVSSPPSPKTGHSSQSPSHVSELSLSPTVPMPAPSPDPAVPSNTCGSHSISSFPLSEPRHLDFASYVSALQDRWQKESEASGGDCYRCVEVLRLCGQQKLQPQELPVIKQHKETH